MAAAASTGLWLTGRVPAAARKNDMTDLPVTFADVEAAHRRIAGIVLDTPCLESRTLGAMLGGRLWLKFENHQFTASFKERGALNTLLQLPDDARARGVIAMSAGNHAQGVAYHANRLGISSVIVMPAAAPLVKVMNTERHGARVVLSGHSLEEAAETARQIAADEGRTFVHPYDDPRIVAGQGTCAVEILHAVPEIDTLVVPIGGGGLIGRMAIAAKALKPSIRVIGVQSEKNPAMALAMKGEKQLVPGESLAEGIAVKSPGVLNQEIVRALVDEIVVVPESVIERAIGLLIEIEKTVAEGAGAAGLAALLHRPDLALGRKVATPVCGGNIDTRLLASVLARNLAHDGRLTQLRVAVPDRPGQLHRVTSICAEEKANIVEIIHRRTHSDASAKDVVVDLEIETRDQTHLDRVLAAFATAGMKVRIVERVS
jgi:threonine dehydratase